MMSLFTPFTLPMMNISILCTPALNLSGIFHDYYCMLSASDDGPFLNASYLCYQKITNSIQSQEPLKKSRQHIYHKLCVFLKLGEYSKKSWYMILKSSLSKTLNRKNLQCRVLLDWVSKVNNFFNNWLSKVLQSKQI